MNVLVEVDVATHRPVGIHARTYIWLSIEEKPGDRWHVQIQAEETAMMMAMTHSWCEMVLGARVIDWEENDDDGTDHVDDQPR